LILTYTTNPPTNPETSIFCEKDTLVFNSGYGIKVVLHFYEVFFGYLY